MAFHLQIKNNITIPKGISFKDELKHIADRFIIPEIHKRMDSEESLDGQKYPPLADSTLEMKAKKGQPSKVLLATGQLRKSIYSRSLSKSKVLITVHPIRKEVGEILQFEGVRSKAFGKRRFNFFGINTDAEKRSIDYMQKKLTEKLGGKGAK